MQNNLYTTIRAYCKLSPSELDKYVKKADLSTELSDYVKEAPDDSAVYGRQDKKWVELEPDIVRKIQLYYGESNEGKFTSFTDITSLERHDEIARLSKADSQEVIIDYTLPKVGYFWLCCSFEITSIFCFDDSLTVGCVYNDNDRELIEGDDGLTYHCYRLESHLIKNHPWKFRITVK